MFISNALASAEAMATTEPNPMAGSLIQIVLIFAIFYFILIRPQQKKAKEQENMLKAIVVGDEVLTGGGVYAEVVAADESTLTVEFAKDVKVKISRMSVRDVVSKK